MPRLPGALPPRASCRRGGPLVGNRQHQRKRAALARIARELELAAEEPRQLATDREPEPGAAVLAAGAAVGLLERLEDDSLLVGRDADAGIADREGHRARVARRDAQAHGALLRELEGVGDEVLQDLLQARRIGADGGRQ